MSEQDDRDWRQQVLAEAEDLEQVLYTSPRGRFDARQLVHIQTVIDRARQSAGSGRPLEATGDSETEAQAFAYLDEARSNLGIDEANPETLMSTQETPVETRSHVFHFSSEPPVAEAVESVEPAIQDVAATTIDSEELAERLAVESESEPVQAITERVVEPLPVETDSAATRTPETAHETASSAKALPATREQSEEAWTLHRWLVGGGLLLTVGLIIAFIFVDGTLRAVIGLGAAAGLVAASPYMSRLASRRPYNSFWLAAWVKAVAGAVGAFVAVLVLHWGFGPLEPAEGRSSLFYAIVFGFAQQLLTGPWDRWLVRKARKQRLETPRFRANADNVESGRASTLKAVHDKGTPGKLSEATLSPSAGA